MASLTLLASRRAAAVGRRGAAVRRAFTQQSSRSWGNGATLKVLIVDGYAASSRAEFTAVGLPFASELYKDMLTRHSPVPLDFHTVFPCSDEYEPLGDAALAAFDGAAFTGSSYSAYAPDEDVRRQVELMSRTFECGVSSFGSCWALQIASVALGGTVELNPMGREVGVGQKIALTAEGRGHPMFAGKKSANPSAPI